MTRITQSQVKTVELPLSTPFHTSLRSAYSVIDIRVILETDDGTRGFGSASPTAKITGETRESIEAALAEFVIPAVEAADLDDEFAAFEAIHKSVVYNNAAKAAVDIALHDIFARRRGLSLSDYVRLKARFGQNLPKPGPSGTDQFGGNAVDHHPLGPVETDATVSLNTPDAMEQQALTLSKAGFRFLKIKLGGRDGQDAIRVQRIRQALGPEMPLRVDANQAWSVKESIDYIRQLAAFEVEFVEQPVYMRDLLGLREVTKQSPIPIAADESVFDHYDLAHVLHLQAAHIINLKLMKTGGLHPAIQMVKTIEDAGLDWMVGSMMEGPASVTAAATLADALESRYKDLDAAYFLSHQMATGGPVYENGELHFTDGTGLGVVFTDENGDPDRIDHSDPQSGKEEVQ